MYLTIQIKPSHWKILLLILIIMASIAGGLCFRLLYPMKYIDLIDEHSKIYNLEPAFICAVINAESRFNKEAVSPKGASGLMQLTQVTANWIASEMEIPNYSYDRIFEPELNISIGTYYLRKLEDRFGEATLAAYNAGSGNVTKWLSNPDYSKDGLTLSYIPFYETRQYVSRVNKYFKIYSFIYKYFK